MSVLMPGPHSFDSLALWSVLQLGNVCLSTLFLVFKIFVVVVAVLGPLPFYIIFKISLSISGGKKKISWS